MLAVPGVVVVYGFNAAVVELLGQLSIPVHIGEAFAAAVRLGYGFNLDTEVVVSHGDEWWGVGIEGLLGVYEMLQEEGGRVGRWVGGWMW